MDSQNHITVTDLSLLYPQGTVVDARVILVKPFEALVELEDGTQGFVRNRELSWDSEPDHAGEVIQKGQTIKAMVLGVDDLRKRLKLSLRQAERDPWRDIWRRYSVGDVVRCRVTSLLRRDAFVELEPAVEGYIPLQEICKVPPRRMEDVIWIGDAVDAVITNLQIPKRRVALSVRKHLAQLENRSARARYQRHYFTHLTGTRAPMSDLISGEDRLALLNFAKARQNPGDEQIQTDTLAFLNSSDGADCRRQRLLGRGSGFDGSEYAFPVRSNLRRSSPSTQFSGNSQS
jgi:predicted RNA-binding protein with RPS1 domain